MSAHEEMEFVVKKVFTDVTTMRTFNMQYEEKETYFNVPWRISRSKYDDGRLTIGLECLKNHSVENCFIEFEVEIKLISTAGENLCKTHKVWLSTNSHHFEFSPAEVEKYLFDGKLTVELRVNISLMVGIRTEKLRSFDESTKEFSDVVLKVEDGKFYVLKKYLAAHSTYFQSLFFGNFDESKQSEITLSGINRWDFQNFLEVLYSEPAIDDNTIDGILHLADMYDSKTAIERCEEFLNEKSKRNSKEKLEMATKYKMDLLKTNLSKMSSAEEKKFVMKKVFTDVTTMRSYNRQYEKKETYFNVPWRISISKYNDGILNIALQCLNHNVENHFIESEAEIKLISITGGILCKTHKNRLDLLGINRHYFEFSTAEVEKYIYDGKLAVELHVNIVSMVGIRTEKLRSFDESTKEFSDVVLTVEDEKFYVLKKYLAAHSTYFQSLFFGNFDESTQSEITLSGINRWDFQNFLEILYSEPAIDDNTIGGILHLADMYDSKTAIKRCEEFLIEKSKWTLKEKFEVVTKFKMDRLKEECLSEMRTKQDVLSVMPRDAKDIEPEVWKELVYKIASLY